jgi:pseudomonalisin/xanthomonalisin
MMRSVLVRTLVGAMAAGLLAAPSAFAAPRGMAPLRLKGATTTGALHRAQLPVTLVMAPRNAAGLARAAKAHSLERGQFRSRFGPSKSTMTALRTWARRNGLRVASVAANGLVIRVTGSSAHVSRAFRTQLRTFRSGSHAFYAPSTRAGMPHAVSRHVVSVLGLSNLGRVGLHARAHASQLPGGVTIPTSYGPKDFWQLYHAPSSVTGAGQGLSVIAEGDVSQPQKDLVTFEDKFGLPHVTWSTIRTGAASTDTSGDDEWDLDTQYSTGFAPGVTALNVYDGPSLSNDDILAEINRWVTDDSTKQASFSAGECEILAYATGFVSGLDTVLEAAAAQGQTLFTSSGDTGAFCSAVVGVNGVPAGIPNVAYPAASPFAIGVGGTTVLGPGPTEIAWYAGGGGSSFFETTPTWQANAGGSFLGARRGVPDVALDADPNSGYDVIVNGQEETIGGTSAGAPSWQGIWARAQSGHSGALGFAGPVIYETEPASAFHDITLGGNPVPATPGWDYVTGRGTPDITAFVNGA